MTPATCPTCGNPLPADTPGAACPRCLLQAGFATGGGAPADRTPSAEELAPKFPGLVIGPVLGRGGMGVVYRARHKALDREVALKVLPASLAGDAAFAERFQREARALAKLQHVNIVGVHDFGQTDGLFWLVMEFVDGANIRQAMKAGAIGPKEALAIVPQICDALQYAHEHGVVHRDIKPENVLLDKSGRVKVADFGLAKMMEHGAADRSLTGVGQVMGTPHYMAPEQWEKPKDVDHRADIYSLGVVFYEMLTGELPVGRFAAPSKKSDVDARIDEIVLRTLEREREARYQHVSEVKTDVGAVASSPAAAAPKPAAPARRLHWGWWIALGLILLCGGPAALIGTMALGNREHRSMKDYIKEGAVDVAPPPAAPGSSLLSDDLRRIDTKWTRLQELGLGAEFEKVLRIYADEDRGPLMSMSDAERKSRGSGAELGLPLLASERLANPLTAFRITTARVRAADGNVADVTATDGFVIVKFPMRRSRDGRVWDFALGPVEVK